MSDFREMAEISAIFDCQKKFKLLEYGCDTYRFNTPDLGFQIFKFRDFMGNNIFRENPKSVHKKRAKFKYFAKVITYSKSSDHVLQEYT